jgi:hypothetical protein
MGRIARLTEDLGSDAGGFYVEPPDIPDGVTCQEWRRLRSEIREPQVPASGPATSAWRTPVTRGAAFRVPALRTAFS